MKFRLKISGQASVYCKNICQCWNTAASSYRTNNGRFLLRICIWIHQWSHIYYGCIRGIWLPKLRSRISQTCPGGARMACNTSKDAVFCGNRLTKAFGGIGGGKKFPAETIGGRFYPLPPLGLRGLIVCSSYILGNKSTETDYNSRIDGGVACRVLRYRVNMASAARSASEPRSMKVNLRDGARNGVQRQNWIRYSVYYIVWFQHKTSPWKASLNCLLSSAATYPSIIHLLFQGHAAR